MIPHEQFFNFHSKNNKRKQTITLVMLMICVQTFQIQCSRGVQSCAWCDACLEHPFWAWTRQDLSVWGVTLAAALCPKNRIHEHTAHFCWFMFCFGYSYHEPLLLSNFSVYRVNAMIRFHVGPCKDTVCLAHAMASFQLCRYDSFSKNHM